MPQTIEYLKQYTETVFINLPGPEEPAPQMSGGELLHGYLADLYRSPSPEVKAFVTALCGKWNVHYRQSKA
jgi:hypothetical protein